MLRAFRGVQQLRSTAQHPRHECSYQSPGTSGWDHGASASTQLQLVLRASRGVHSRGQRLSTHVRKCSYQSAVFRPTPEVCPHGHDLKPPVPAQHLVPPLLDGDGTCLADSSMASAPEISLLAHRSDASPSGGSDLSSSTSSWTAHGSGHLSIQKSERLSHPPGGPSTRAATRS